MRRLFNKLKSQNIEYDIDFPNDDQAHTHAYCVGYNIKSAQIINNRLYFRRIDNRGWNLLDHNADNHMIFDPKEFQDLYRYCYWAVRITPEVAKQLLQQRRKAIQCTG